MENIINKKIVKNIILGSLFYCGFQGSTASNQASSFKNSVAASQPTEVQLTLQQKIEMDLLEMQDRIFDAERMIGYYSQFFEKWEGTLYGLNERGINAHKYLALNVENLRMEACMLRFKIALVDLDKCRQFLEEDLDAISQSNGQEGIIIYESIVDHLEGMKAILSDVEGLGMEYPEAKIIPLEIYHEKIRDILLEGEDYRQQAQGLLGPNMPNTNKFPEIIKALEERSRNQDDPFYQLALKMLKIV